MAFLSLRESFKRSFCSSKSSKIVLENIKVKENVKINASFLTKLLGITHPRSSKILDEHKELLSVTQKEAFNTTIFLKSLGYPIQEIYKRPMILYVNELTFRNRHEILHEVGIEKQKIDLSLLFKYVKLVNRDLDTLKGQGYIPKELDVQRKLIECFEDVQVPEDKSIQENIALKFLRQNVLSSYLKIKLRMTTDDEKKLWSACARVKHKSFRAVSKMMNLLIKDLEFPTERIVKNIFLVYGDPENLEMIIKNIKTIGGDDIREVLYRRPKLIMSSFEAIQKSLEHLHSFNIPDSSIRRCTELLTLGPDTILERLQDLNDVEEFEALSTNPRILRLVHYQNKARLRLDYLQHLKVKCASLHILSCSSEAFAKFAQDGSDRTKGRDIVHLLAEKLKMDPVEIRDKLSRHPNWCHVTAVQTKKCFEFLITMKFSEMDIFFNIHLLLYPITRIDEKLKILQNKEIYQEMNLNANYTQVSNRQLLSLILYILESEYHFTGDGIWNESHTQSVENFSNLLPDFPEGYQKNYKQPTVDSHRFNIL